MDRTHPWYELRQALIHRMAEESRFYTLPQFTKDYPAIVYLHLHLSLKARAWRDPDHLMRLCWRNHAFITAHSHIQFARGGWMSVGTMGCTLTGPPRMLMKQLVCMNLHENFAVKNIAGDNDFAIFNRMCQSWVQEQMGIEKGFSQRMERKTKQDGMSPYDPPEALNKFR